MRNIKLIIEYDGKSFIIIFKIKECIKEIEIKNAEIIINNINE